MITSNSSIFTQPYVSYRGMHKSARNLDAVLFLYFPLYGLSHKDFFTYYPTLGFVEALICQADESIEENQASKLFSAGINSWNRTKNLIVAFLKEKQVYSLIVEKYLSDLDKYCELENQLMSQEQVTHVNVRRAAELRTSDLRTLHAILLQLINKPYSKEIFDTMWALEVLADLGDDVEQYKDDVEKDHYNTYRMFVKLYGDKALEYFQAEIEWYKKLFQEKLLKLPHDEQEGHLKTVFKYQEAYFSKSIPERII
jgi:hypothetical protein